MSYGDGPYQKIWGLGDQDTEGTAYGNITSHSNWYQWEHYEPYDSGNVGIGGWNATFDSGFWNCRWYGLKWFWLRQHYNDWVGYTCEDGANQCSQQLVIFSVWTNDDESQLGVGDADWVSAPIWCICGDLNDLCMNPTLPDSWYANISAYGGESVGSMTIDIDTVLTGIPATGIVSIEDKSDPVDDSYKTYELRYSSWDNTGGPGTYGRFYLIDPVPIVVHTLDRVRFSIKDWFDGFPEFELYGRYIKINMHFDVPAACPGP